MTLHFLNDVANDAESAQKSIFTPESLVCSVNRLSRLINRIPGSHLLISSSLGLASRTHVELLGKPRDVNEHSQSLAWYLDIKKHSPSILYIPPDHPLNGYGLWSI